MITTVKRYDNYDNMIKAYTALFSYCTVVHCCYSVWRHKPVALQQLAAVASPPLFENKGHFVGHVPRRLAPPGYVA